MLDFFSPFLYSPDIASSEYNLSSMMEIGKIGGSWGKVSKSFIWAIQHLVMSLESMSITGNQNDHFAQFPKEAESGMLCKETHTTGKQSFENI